MTATEDVTEQGLVKVGRNGSKVHHALIVYRPDDSGTGKRKIVGCYVSCGAQSNNPNKRPVFVMTPEYDVVATCEKCKKRHAD